MGDPLRDWKLLDELSYEQLEDAPEFDGDGFEIYEQVYVGADDEAPRLVWDIDALVDRYARSLSELHFHYWVRPGGPDGNLDEWRAVYKRAGKRGPKAPVASNRPDILGADDVPPDRLDRYCRSDEHAVFVFVAQGLQHGERVLDGVSSEAPAVRIQSVVRLQSIHHQHVSLGSAGQPSLTAAPMPERTYVDRKLGAGARHFVVRLDELPREVVERRARVVDELADEQPPFMRRRFEDADVQDVLLRGTRVVLAGDSIRMLLEPGFDLPIQRFKMGVRPVELDAEVG